MKQRSFAGVFTTAGALVILVVCLAAIDTDVREQMARMFQGGAPTAAVSIASDVRSLAAVVFVAARDQSIEHAPLVMFALAATVLVLFMLRT
jgi:hypothetical protein